MNRPAFLSAIILLAAVGALGRRAEAAGPFHAGEAIPALAQRLFDWDPAVRQAAVLALGAMGPEARAAIPALAQRLGDPDRYVASDASIVLKSMGADAVPSVVQVLHFEDPYARELALRTFVA